MSDPRYPDPDPLFTAEDELAPYRPDGVPGPALVLAIVVGLVAVIVGLAWVVRG